MGVSELADEIVSARGQKTCCHANILAASAAYLEIGCSASEFYVTPVCRVGSIGRLESHFDYSQAFCQHSQTDMILGAENPTVEGKAVVPLDDERRVSCQSRGDGLHSESQGGGVRAGVSGCRSRRCVRGMGQGRVLRREAAKAPRHDLMGWPRLDDVQEEMRRDAKPLPSRGRLAWHRRGMPWPSVTREAPWRTYMLARLRAVVTY